MDIKPTRRNERFGGTTCAYWLAGRCNRNPCRFLHRETPSPSVPTYYNNANNAYRHTRKPYSSAEMTTPKYNSKTILVRKTRKTGGEGDGTIVTKAFEKSSKSICRYWVNGNCVHGDQCRNLHSWFYGDGFSTLAKLQQHKKVTLFSYLTEMCISCFVLEMSY